jgi:hypothetical protein
MNIQDNQISQLQRRYPDARVEQSTDGQQLLVIPNVRCGTAWNVDCVTMRVLVPAGFPHVKPDCFYTESNLRLQNGGEPVSSSLQNVFDGQYRWFSWHLMSWDPTTGSLDQYVRFCQRRLMEVR